MDGDATKGLGFLITLLIFFNARRKKKAAEQKSQDVRAYEPIEPEESRILPQTLEVMSKGAGTIQFFGLLFILGVVGCGFFTDSLVRWIILGTIALMALIAFIFKRRGTRQDPVFDRTTDFDIDDIWED